MITATNGGTRCWLRWYRKWVVTQLFWKLISTIVVSHNTANNTKYFNDYITIIDDLW